MGGYFGGYETKNFTVYGDKVHLEIERTLEPDISNGTKDLDAKKFFNGLKNLNIGEWRKSYDTHRYGIAIMDGTH
ncbi:MAG: hypothetical protein U0M42_08660 [Acutalibacteraceae bacterium]|nr:hypothetical protein [Acutalibacteraceae bacterium]